MSSHADTAADLLAAAALPTLDGHPNTASIDMAGVYATLALAEAIERATRTLATALANPANPDNPDNSQPGNEPPAGRRPDLTRSPRPSQNHMLDDRGGR
jgi:hypothetical protein